VIVTFPCVEGLSGTLPLPVSAVEFVELLTVIIVVRLELAVVEVTIEVVPFVKVL
jgi:hypothetical protein